MRFVNIVNDEYEKVGECWDPTVAAGDDVKTVATQLGASNATRFRGVILVGWFQPGEYNVKFVMQVNGSELVVLRGYTVIVTAA